MELRERRKKCLVVGREIVIFPVSRKEERKTAGRGD
jgi:hypothetical protein